MKNEKIQVDLQKLRTLIDSDPERKKAVASAIGGVRQTVSKILTGSRCLYAEELLAVAEIYEIDPRELAIRV